MMFLKKPTDHDEHDHDDHGGLHRDLTATGAAMDRRNMLRMATRFGLDLVYATTGYSAYVANLNGISLATDGIFSDGAALELATVTGEVTNGMTAALTIGI